MEASTSKRRSEETIPEKSVWAERGMFVATLLLQGVIMGLGTSMGQAAFQKMTSRNSALSFDDDNVVDIKKSRVG